MFLSKIWLFLITLGAAIALTIALVLPRPAQREFVKEEHDRLAVACGVIDVLLGDDARNRVAVAGSFARQAPIVAGLQGASAADHLDEARMRSVREQARAVLKGIHGEQPSFVMLLDRRGRLVARVGADEDEFGDVYAGRPIVDDALAGFVRDDVWVEKGTLFLVAASPVVQVDPPVSYVGAVVLGNKVSTDLAKQFVSSLNVDVGFFLPDADVAASGTLAIDREPMTKAVDALKGSDLGEDCKLSKPFDVKAGNQDYTALVARMPGEAQLRHAFYTVLIKRPVARGFAGTLSVVRQNDLSFGNFPWILVGAGFLIALGIGIAFMWVESDRPLRRLAADALQLANGKTERLGEDKHGGKFGSIARSVNIHVDKVGREAKSARTNLDQLLGPAPEGSLGTIDLLAGAPLPPMRPGGPAPAMPPPASDFRFNDAPPPAPPPPRMAPPAMPAMPGMQAPPRAPTPPPMRSMTPPMAAPQMPAMAAMPAVASGPVGRPGPASAPLRLDEDILGDMPTTLGAPLDLDGDQGYFRQVFEQFLAVKKSCGEPVAGLTFEKFSDKLVKNREDLKAKTGCRDVRFTVYVKDGKAALKATPVKE
jgi:hypothetical protein